MSKQKIKEAALSAEYLEAIIENSFDGIYITDGNAVTLKTNKAYTEITGLKKSDVIGKSMSELVKNGTLSESGSIMALKQKKPVTLEQKFRTGKHALITSTPLFDENGDVVLVITNVRDTTELNRLKKEADRLKDEELRLREELKFHASFDDFNGESMVVSDKKTAECVKLADKVAPLDTTVILLGETGVGKEIFAKYIHRQSKRADKPFIKVNCGAIPASLVESELFGYEKGSFTGADKNGKMGLFELADTGTVFLDEVGELTLDMQVKLLRVLQDGEIKRVGGQRPVKIDVRILAATNRDLGEMVKEKLFRQDLYYRLMVFPINILPLRERGDDILPLARMFLNGLNKKYDYGKYFSPEALDMLRRYNWPGNIRELRNIVERAVIISAGDEMGSTCLPLFTAATGISSPVAPGRNSEADGNLKNTVESMELEYMSRAYNTYGNVRDAAKSLGMTPSTFVRKRRKYTEAMEAKERGENK